MIYKFNYWKVRTINVETLLKTKKTYLKQIWKISIEDILKTKQYFKTT